MRLKNYYPELANNTELQEDFKRLEVEMIESRKREIEEHKKREIEKREAALLAKEKKHEKMMALKAKHEEELPMKKGKLEKTPQKQPGDHNSLNAIKSPKHEQHEEKTDDNAESGKCVVPKAKDEEREKHMTGEEKTSENKIGSEVNNEKLSDSKECGRVKSIQVLGTCVTGEDLNDPISRGLVTPEKEDKVTRDEKTLENMGVMKQKKHQVEELSEKKDRPGKSGDAHNVVETEDSGTVEKVDKPAADKEMLVTMEARNDSVTTMDEVEDEMAADKSESLKKDTGKIDEIIPGIVESKMDTDEVVEETAVVKSEEIMETNSSVNDTDIQKTGQSTNPIQGNSKDTSEKTETDVKNSITTSEADAKEDGIMTKDEQDKDCSSSDKTTSVPDSEPSN